jgi:hypothetical protein
MELLFVLDEHGDPKVEHDVRAWTRWYERADRGIARTAVTPRVTVLTTFNGFDEEREADEAPRLFETRVVGGVLDGEHAAHLSRTEALAAHAELAQWCRIGNAADVGLDEEGDEKGRVPFCRRPN